MVKNTEERGIIMKEKDLLPYTLARARELLGQGKVCDCGEPLPKGETYCELCQEMYQDRLETERRIEAEEIRREGNR